MPLRNEYMKLRETFKVLNICFNFKNEAVSEMKSGIIYCQLLRRLKYS